MTAVVDVASLEDFAALLAGVAADFQGIAWREWTEREFAALEGFHDQGFAAERSPAGQPWEPLRPSTVRKKGHDTILWETSRLRRSLTGPGDDAVRAVEGAWPELGLVFGTNVPYSRYHSRLDGHAHRLPAREHVGVDGRFIDQATERAADHALKEMLR